MGAPRLTSAGLRLWKDAAPVQIPLTKAPAPRSIWEGSLPYLLLGFAYWTAAVFAMLWAGGSGSGAPLWPAGGIALGGLLIGGIRLWPAIVVARLLAAMTAGTQHALWVEVILGFTNASAAVAGAYLIKRYLPIDPRLETLRDMASLAAASFLSATVSTVLGVGLLGLTLGFAPQQMIWVGAAWWCGHVVGALLMGALILIFSQPENQFQTTRQAAGLSLLLACGAIVSYLIFMQADATLLRAWHIFPILIWGALAFYVRGAALLLVILTFCASWGATLGTGPFGDVVGTAGERSSLAQEFALLTALPTLFLAATADERRAKRALETAQARLRLALASAKAGFWEVQLQPDRLFWDESFRALYGFPPDEQATIEKWRARVHEADLPRVVGAHEAALAGAEDKWEQTFRIHHPQLGERWIQDRVWLKRNAGGEATSLGGLNIDVTDHTLAERAVREARDRLDLAVRVHGIGIADWSIKTDQMVWNERQEQIFGLAPGAFEGRFSDFTKRLLPKDAAAFQTGLTEAFAEHASMHCFAVGARRADGEIRQIEGAGRIFYDAAGMPERFIATSMDVTERKNDEERIQLLMGELNHRAKNLLAIVQAIVWQTVDGGEPRDFAAQLSERLRALSASNDLLVRSAWQHVDLKALIVTQLDPFVGVPGDRVALAGPEVKLKPAAVQVLGMAFHELATNAVKYGALSQSSGRVSITWDVTETGGEPVFEMTWRETGGPAVTPPETQGFGTSVIVQAVEFALHAEVALDFPVAGARWRAVAPLENVTGAPSRSDPTQALGAVKRA